jgi:DNA polymerase
MGKSSMKNFVVVDFETRATIDLRKVGSTVYIKHPHTEIMSGVWKKGDQVIVWCPGLNKEANSWHEAVNSKLGLQVDYSPLDKPPKLIREWAKLPWLAHNADGFDSILWNEHCDRHKLPKAFKPASWTDTIHLARMADYPAGLAKLLPAVLPDAQKDNSSSMLFLSKCRTMGKARGPYYIRGNPEIWYKMLKYNILDVVNLEELFANLVDKLDGSYEMQVESIETHRQINSYGLLVDVKWINNLVAHWQLLGAESSATASKIVGWNVNLRSPQQVINIIQKLGVKLSGNSLNKSVVDQILEEPEKFFDINDSQAMLAVEILSLRQNVAKATIGKVNKIRSLIYGKEPVIRNWAVYNGAHTGRYTSVGIQLHNLPRGDGATGKLTKWPLKELASRAKPMDASLLTELTRGAFIPRPGHKFGVYDYSAVEARGCAWLVQCKKILDIYHAGGDPYVSLSSKIYGIPEVDITEDQRFVGKQGILSCQYQVGPDRFQVMCEAYGIELEAIGITSKQVVDVYRSEYPEYPQFWKDIQRACLDVVGGREYECNLGGPNGNAIRVYMHRDGLMLRLPSGRSIRYNNATIIMKDTPWGSKAPAVQYMHPRYGPVDLYGGLETENIVQGMCKDIFQRGVDKRMYQCVLHAHDEAVVEIPDNGRPALTLTKFTKYGKMMSSDVKWAPGMPIGVEGFLTDRYCKKPLKGTKKYKFLRGKVQ